MIDLKPYYDKVMSSEAEVQRIASELDALYHQDTEESKAQMLEKKADLDQALALHDEAVSDYERMLKVNRPNDVAKNFVPVSNTTPDEGDGSQPTTIKRQEYDRLSLLDRARYVKSGGTVED